MGRDAGADSRNRSGRPARGGAAVRDDADPARLAGTGGGDLEARGARVFRRRRLGGRSRRLGGRSQRLGRCRGWHGRLSDRFVGDHRRRRLGRRRRGRDRLGAGHDHRCGCVGRRGSGRRRRRRGRRRRARVRRPRREECERVEVAVGVGRPPHAEVHVGRVERRRPGGPGGPDRRSLGDDGAALHRDRRQVDEGDRVAVAGGDRHRQPVPGNRAREGHGPLAGRDDGLSLRSSDDDPPALAAGVGVGAELEALQDRP